VTLASTILCGWGLGNGYGAIILLPNLNFILAAARLTLGCWHIRFT